MRPHGVPPLAAALLLLVALSGCAAEADKQGELRVVSWNVARGYAFDLGAVSERWTVLGTLRDDPRLQAADVVALQEVCGDKGARDVGRVASAMGTPHVWFRRADPSKDGTCREGQAILSRWPISDAGALLLPAARAMRKTAVWVDLRLPGERRVRVWNVHLDHSVSPANNVTLPEDDVAARAAQLAPVLDRIEASRQRDPARGVVLTGDFNTLEDHEPALDAAAALMQPAVPGDEASHVLGWRLDHLFFTGLQRRAGAVLRLPGSDHFALMADFDLPSGLSPPGAPRCGPAGRSPCRAGSLLP